MKDTRRRANRDLSRLGQVFLGFALIATALVGGLMMPAAAAPGGSNDATLTTKAAGPPKEIQYLCSRKSDGLLRYVTRPSKCAGRTEVSLKLPDDGPVYACASKKSGEPVRRVSNLNKCSSKETGITLPPENDPIYFCAAEKTGALRRVSSMGECGGRRGIPVFVSPTNRAPVSDAQNVMTNEDESTNITLTASDPDGDAVTYAVVDDPSHGTLSGTAPDLTYAPDLDYNGDDSFTFKANDGVKDGDTATVEISVAPVNDAPSFTEGPDQSVDEDPGAQSVSGWATDIKKGADALGNESSQSLTFEVTDNTNSALFTEGPAVSPNGTLTYKPADDENGEATIKVRLKDDGGTDRGGDDASDEQEFKVTVGEVNDDPRVSVADNGPIDEGGSATITATANDPDIGSGSLSYEFDCDGNGNYNDAGDKGPQADNSASCSFDDGNGTVNVRVSDGAGGVGTGSTSVTVNNVAPTATLANDGPVDEGSPATVSFTNQADASNADTTAGFRYEYNCDGGQFAGDPDYQSASTDATKQCTFDNDGIHTVRGRIIDKDGGANSYTTDVTVGDVRPTVTLDGQSQVSESTSIEREYTFSINDPGNDTFEVVTPDFPSCGANGELVDSNGADEGGTFTYDPQTRQGSFKCVFPDGPATSDVTIKVRDKVSGITDTDTQPVKVETTVDNEPPTVTISGDDTADEGETKHYSFTVTDPGDDPNPTIDTSCGTDATKTNETADGFDCTFPDGDGADGTIYTVTVNADDGDDTGTDTKDVTVSNLAPTADAQSVSIDEDDAGETLTLAGSDPANDPPTIRDALTFRITSLPDNGKLYKGSGTTDEITSADLPAVLGGSDVTYVPNTEYFGDDSFDFEVCDDGTPALCDDAAVDITITAVNDRPVVDLNGPGDGTGSTAEFFEADGPDGGDPVTLAPDVAVSDVDDENIESATLTLTNRPDGDDESLSVDVSGTSITASNYDSSSGELTLSGTATKDEYRQVLATVEYDNTAPPPTREDRTVEFTVNDGDENSDVATATVTVTPLNEAPVVDLNGASNDGIDTTASFTEGGSILIAPDTIVTDADDQELFSATITLKNPLDGESLSAGSSGPITATPYNSSTGVLKFSGTNFLNQYQEVLRTVRYTNSSQNPDDTPREIQFVVNDQQDNSIVAKSTVSITPENDAPEITTSSGALSYTENGAATAIDDALTLTDVDSENITGATVSITNILFSGDVLAFEDTANITGSYDSGVLTLDGDDSVANYEAALKSVKYNSTSENPSTATRTVTFRATDDGTPNATSDPATKDIAVTAVNDAPEITVPPSISVTEDVASALTGLSVSDADAGNNQITLTLSVPSGSLPAGSTVNVFVSSPDDGEVMLTGTAPDINAFIANGNVKFLTANNATANVTLTVDANDGGYTGSDPGNTGTATSEADSKTTTLTVDAVNDAPVNNVPSGPFNGATGTNLPLTDISVSDVDAGDANVLVTLFVENANNGGFTLRTDVSGGLVAADITGNGSNNVRVEAPLARINATLSATNGLVYNNPDGDNYTFDFTTNDQENTGSGGAKIATTSRSIIIDAPPSVTSTNPANNAPDVALGGNITVDFSEAVNANASSFELKCPTTGTARSLAVTGSGNNSLTLNPDADLPGATVCQVRVIANGISDTDTNDPPNNMVADHTFTFTTAPKAVADDYKDTFTVVGNVSYDSANSSPVRSVLDNDEKNDSTTVTNFSPTSAQGGNVNVRANGTFTYNPPAGYEGLDTFTYTVNGGSQATVTLRVGGMVWFVNNNSGACSSNCDGRLSNPFTSLSAFNTVNNGTGPTSTNPAPDDNVFLFESSTNYAGSVTLLANQKLIGQDATDSLATITSLTRPSGSAAFPTMSTVNATKSIITNSSGNGVNVGSGNTLRGFTVGDTTGSDINGSSFGTLRILDVSLIGTGQALNLTTGTLTGAGLDTLTSTNGTNNVSLTSVGTSGGAFNLSVNSTTPGALSGASSDAFKVNGGSGSFSYSGNISNTNTLAANVQNKTGGTVTLSGDINPSGGSNAKGISLSGNSTGANTITFSGANKKISTGSGTGVNLSNNAGATINFTNGGLDIDATSGTGLSATGGGTVTVQTGTNPNTIDTSTGTALNVANTTIGSSNLNFRSISAGPSSGTGPTNGIVLNTTGSSGGLKVTGNGGSCTPTTPTCTGGTIQHTGSHGIVLTSTSNVEFNLMSIHDTGDHGIKGDGVNNFTFRDSRIFNFGDTNVSNGGTEDAMIFDDPASVTDAGHGLTGTATIQRSTIGPDGHFVLTPSSPGPPNSGIVVRNWADANLTMNVTGTKFTQVSNDPIDVQIQKGSGTLNVDGSTADGANTFDQLNGGIRFKDSVDDAANGTLELTIKNNTFTDVGIGAEWIADGGTVLNARFNNNTLSNVKDDSVRALSSPSGFAAPGNTTTRAEMNTTISGNNMGGGTLFIAARRGGVANVSLGPNTGIGNITNSTYANYGRNSIFAEAKRGGRLNIDMLNNTVVTKGGTVDGSVNFQSGDLEALPAGIPSTVICANIKNNNISMNPANSAKDIVIDNNDNLDTSKIHLEGFGGGGNAAATTFLAGQNTLADTPPVVYAGTASAGIGDCVTSTP